MTQRFTQEQLDKRMQYALSAESTAVRPALMARYISELVSEVSRLYEDLDRKDATLTRAMRVVEELRNTMRRKTDWTYQYPVVANQLRAALAAFDQPETPKRLPLEEGDVFERTQGDDGAGGHS